MEIEASKKAVAQNRLREGRDPRRPRGLLGPGRAGRLCVQGLARRQAVDPSLSHPPRRGRTGRLRLPSGWGAIRALDLRRPAGRARKGDRRDQPLRPRRRGVGEGGGADCGARPCPGQPPEGREHHGRFRLCALSARGVHRMGRRLRNRLLGLPVRRRKSFRDVGRILTGNGGSDSFWWRSTTSRYFRLTVHETSAPEGAIVSELKLRILNKDRMPIGQLERAAAAGRHDLYPQSLLGRQVYWTALGKYDEAEQALFDEYGNLEPQRGSPQITPLIQLGRALHGAPASALISQTLAGGSLPI